MALGFLAKDGALVARLVRVLGMVGSLGYGRGMVRGWLGPVCSGKGL